MAKKIQITFNNPIDESNIDHLEVWWKLGVGGTYVQLGSDIAFATGVSAYTTDDVSANVVDDAVLYYDVRSYNSTGQYASVTNSIQITPNTVPDQLLDLVLTEIEYS